MRSRLGLALRISTCWFCMVFLVTPPRPALAATQVAAGRKPAAQGIRLPTLMYHDFGDADRDLVVDKDQFKAQIQYLRDNGYQAISVGDLLEALNGRAALPAKPVILTFDDGYVSHYEFVYPTLKESGMTGAFFVIAGSVGKPGYASWEQLAEMAQAGMEIECHSFSHPDMRQVAAGPRLTRETLGARKLMEEKLSRKVRFFCYPSGRYDDKTIRALQKAGYAAAFTTANRYTDASSGPFALSRLRIRRSDTLELFAEKLKPPAARMSPTLRTSTSGTPAAETAAGRPATGGKTLFQVLRE